MLRPPGAEREGGAAGGAAGGGAAGGGSAGCDATGCADACVGWATGGIEAPEGGADAGVEGGVAVHDSGAAGTGAGGGVGAGIGVGAAAAPTPPRPIGGRTLPRLRLLLERDGVARRRGHLARGRIAIGGILGRRLGDDVVEGGHEIAARRAWAAAGGC